MTVRIGFVNPPPGEDVDWETVLPWLDSEYPDGWVVVKGRPAHTGLAMAMLGFTGTETLEPMWEPAVVYSKSGEDCCRYCKHLRRDHDTPSRTACNHGLCVCFHYEED